MPAQLSGPTATRDGGKEARRVGAPVSSGLQPPLPPLPQPATASTATAAARHVPPCAPAARPEPTLHTMLPPRYAPPLWVGILVITVFFADMSVTGTLQPFYLDDVLHAEVEWVGALITAQFACATIGLFLTGLLADVIGLRRTVILVALANVILLNLAGWTRSVGALLAVRCLLGLVSTYALGLSWVASEPAAAPTVGSGLPPRVLSPTQLRAAAAAAGLAPRARLARWLSATVCIAQLAVMAGGFVAGAMRGQDLALACAIVSIAPAAVVLILLGAREVHPAAAPAPAPAAAQPPAPAAAPAAPSAPPTPVTAAPAPATAAADESSGGTRAGLRRALRTRYFWGIALAPLVQAPARPRPTAQRSRPALRPEPARSAERCAPRCARSQGSFIGGMVQSLAPLVLKTTHGWDEASVGRLFQAPACVGPGYSATAQGLALPSPPPPRASQGPSPSKRARPPARPPAPPSPSQERAPPAPSPCRAPSPQVGGFCALLAHASVTPYLSSVPWRHRAVQALAALIAATSLAYGPPRASPRGPRRRLSSPSAARAPRTLTAAPRPATLRRRPARRDAQRSRLRAAHRGLRRHRHQPRRRQRHGGHVRRKGVRIPEQRSPNP